MTRNAIPSYSAGQVVTAAHMNTYVKDNEAEHWAQIQALQASLIFDTAIVGMLASQSIPQDSITTLYWDVNVQVDPAAMHSTVSNTERLIAQKAGVYDVKLNGQFELNSTGYRWVAIRDQAGNIRAIQTQVGSSSTSLYFSLSVYVRLDVGNFVYANVYHNGSASLNFVRSTNSFPNFSMTYVRSL